MVNRNPLVLAICTLALLVSLSAAVARGDEPVDSNNVWKQWRGPARTSIIESQTPWPSKLSDEALQQVWRVELGPSYSGPIVTEDKIFVTETLDKKFEVVRALDRKTGNQIWERRWEGAMTVPFFAKANGDWIRSTPAYDDGKLYVAGMRDLLVCLDANNGMEIWRVDFVKDLNGELPDFGFVCSPLVDGEHVYVQAGGGLCKLDKRTGQIKWQSLRDGGGMMGSAFSSPIKAKIEGVEQLVVQTRQKLCGVNLETGEMLWSQEVPSFRGMNILTPTVKENRVFTSSYGGKSFLYEVKKTDSGWTVNESWSNRKQGYMSSPVLIDNHVYMHLRNQRCTCIDLATGEDSWTTDTFGKYWSMVANGKQILALDEQGELLLIEADPVEFKLVDSRKIADAETWAHLAIVGDELFIRELNAIAVYRWKGPQ